MSAIQAFDECLCQLADDALALRLAYIPDYERVRFESHLRSIETNLRTVRNLWDDIR